MKSRDLSAFLKSELNRRIADNEAYSLRAFARFLKMDPSTLSKIFRGHRKLGPKAQTNLLTKLNAHFEEASEFFAQIPDDAYDLMPEWYDTAILEQITVTGFKATKKSLAQAFELSEKQIESALLRLKKLKLIRISTAGIVIDATSGQTTNVTPYSTTATKRNLQKQFLKKAIASIDVDPIEDRDMTTITCAIDTEKLPMAKERIKAFRREMSELLTSGRKSNRTYNLTIALYPVTKDTKEFP